jgi:TPR repeat protein
MAQRTKIHRLAIAGALVLVPAALIACQTPPPAKPEVLLTNPSEQHKAEFLKKAKAGDVASIRAYGALLIREDHAKDAAAWYKKFADKGVPAGINGLAIMILQGQGGLPKDEPKALDLFKKAADKGDFGAMDNLCFLYEQGMCGLPKDNAKALFWAKKALEKDPNNAYATAAVKQLDH